MILYGSTISPFVRKVAAYAAEKGIALTLAPGGMGRGGAEFDEASPLGKIPALRDPGADDSDGEPRDFTIADSSAIIAYLEAKFPEPAMIPAGPIPRARVVWWEEFGATVLMRAAGPIFFARFVAKALGMPADEAAAVAAERDQLPPLLDYLERAVPAAGGFLVGEELTLADLAVASPFANLDYVGAGADAARWPRTAAWVASILARASFAGMIDSDRRTVDAVLTRAA